MTAQPTGPGLVQQALTLSRIVAAGHATRDEAEQLVHHAATIAARASTMRGVGQRYHPDADDSAAIRLMHAAGGGGTVATAGEIRAALADRPAPAGLPPEHESGHAPGLAAAR
ncbi:hypothetical protein [Streptomyces aureocirculatus]|uniref:hypothetical protein n=1 Tax=Streptomyces aureocirculatus TaxID=67275 RepID=UPI0004CD069C|nr:hypothetical protein [Streptomyces aureocirculatus]